MTDDNQVTSSDVEGLITAREAAARLGLSVISIRAAFRQGHLSGKRVEHDGGRWSVLLISPASVEAYRATRLGTRAKGSKRKP